MLTPPVFVSMSWSSQLAIPPGGFAIAWEGVFVYPPYKKRRRVSQAPNALRPLFSLRQARKDSTLKHLKAIQDAANSTPETNLPPIDAIVKQRIEQYVVQNDIDPDTAYHLEVIYGMAMQDASVRLCQLIEGDA